MTNWFCVAVKEEEFIREVFSKMEDALEFFEQNFRAEILAHQRTREKKLRSTIANYEARLLKLAREGFTDKDLKHICTLKIEKEKELQRLTAEIEAGPSQYLWQSENLRRELTKEPVFELIRVCGVYIITGGRFEVSDRRYIVYTAPINNAPGPQPELKNLPEPLRGRRKAMLVTPENGWLQKSHSYLLQIKREIKAEQRRIKRPLIKAA